MTIQDVKMSFIFCWISKALYMFHFSLKTHDNSFILQMINYIESRSEEMKVDLNTWEYIWTYKYSNWGFDKRLRDLPFHLPFDNESIHYLHWTHIEFSKCIVSTIWLSDAMVMKNRHINWSTYVQVHISKQDT